MKGESRNFHEKDTMRLGKFCQIKEAWPSMLIEDVTHLIKRRERSSSDGFEVRSMEPAVLKVILFRVCRTPFQKNEETFDVDHR